MKGQILSLMCRNESERLRSDFHIKLVITLMYLHTTVCNMDNDLMEDDSLIES